MTTEYSLPPRDQFVIRPTHDFGFKFLFSHPNDSEHTLLLDFLQTIYHKKFHVIEFKDRILTPAQIFAKEIRLDLRLKCDGILHNIEMQMRITGEEGDRMLYYINCSIQDQIMKGRAYDELIPIYQVILLAENSSIAEDGFNEFLFANTSTHTPLTDKAKAYMINLKKVIASISDYRQMNKLQKWCLFLMHGQETEHEGIKILMEDELFRKAGEIMTIINSDEELKDIAFEKMRREMDERVRLRKAKKTGIEEGLKIGEAKGEKKGDYFRQIKTAIEMLNDNVDLSLIMKYTGLTMPQIIEIENDLPTHQMMSAEKPN